MSHERQTEILAQTSHAKRLLIATGVLSAVTFVAAICTGLSATQGVPQPGLEEAVLALAGSAMIVSRHKARQAIAAIDIDLVNWNQTEAIIALQSRPGIENKAFVVGGVVGAAVGEAEHLTNAGISQAPALHEASTLLMAMTLFGASRDWRNYSALNTIQELSWPSSTTLDASLPRISS